MSNDIIDAIDPTYFKAYFTRDFRYLPTYDSAKTYFLNNIVYLLSTDTFYQCIVSSVSGVQPDTDVTKWTPYNIATTQYILDSDILKAFDQANAYIAPEIFGSDPDKTLQDAFCYLSAHYLCMDMQMAQDGTNSQGSAILSSKSVGSVSASMAIPEKFLKDPQFAYFAQTMYGQKYLAYVFPRITGAPSIAFGWTKP